MRHGIETNVPSQDAPTELALLSKALDSVAVLHGINPINRADSMLIKRDTTAPVFRVIVSGNGAFLRDVISTLDRGGFLD